jgi:hypothetical protein
MHIRLRSVTTAAFLALSIILGHPRDGGATATPTQKCAVAKMKAAFRKAEAKGGCYEKATLTNSAVDPGCLSKAEYKFAVAFQKAEASGGCIMTGDTGTVETTVDSCVGAIVSKEPGNGCTGPDGAGECSGACPSGSVCVATSQMACGCVPAGQMCAFNQSAVCGGFCINTHATCFGHATPPVSCNCLILCGNSAPACGGVCFLGGSCQSNGSGGCSCPNGG